MNSNDSVADTAARLEADIWNEALRHQLSGSLASSTDYDFLNELADRHFPEPNIAIPILRRVVDLRPDNVEAMAKIAEMHVLHGEVDEARVWGSRALDIDPRYVPALYALSQTYRMSEPEREQFADRILQLDPHDFGGVREKVFALYRRAEVDKARNLLSGYIAYVMDKWPRNETLLSAPQHILDAIERHVSFDSLPGGGKHRSL
jgi:tetratricopeptide (TPR) repeat protein